MSRLYFTPVDKAFTLGSSQIKDTQEEINQLTKLILNTKQKQSAPKKESAPEDKSPPAAYEKNDYKRVGNADQQTPAFRPNTAPEDNIDYNLMKVVGHPRFDDIVKNYILVKHPEWLLKESVYVPNDTNSKSNFGNRYYSTVTSDIQRYITFFIISVFVFVLLSAVF